MITIKRKSNPCFLNDAVIAVIGDLQDGYVIAQCGQLQAENKGLFIERTEFEQLENGECRQGILLVLLTALITLNARKNKTV